MSVLRTGSRWVEARVRMALRVPVRVWANVIADSLVWSAVIIRTTCEKEKISSGENILVYFPI